MEVKPIEHCSTTVPFVLALITTLGFFVSLGCLFFVGFPSDNQQLVNALISTLGTVWVLQMGYFFNSSASSKQKDQTIAAMASAPTPPTIPTPIKEPVHETPTT